MEKIMNLGVVEERRTLNENKEGHFGAVIVDKDNNVVSVASNLVLKLHDLSAHAEIMAIRKVCEVLKTHDLSGCKIYATGYPCPMCLSAIMWANIKEIYYGTNLEEAKEIGFRDDFIYNYIKNPNERTLKLEQVGHDECLELFKEYQSK